MIPYANVKVQVLFLGIGRKLTSGNSELSLPSDFICHRKILSYRFCPVHKTITRISPEFFELSLWPDAWSFDIWNIPPRLQVLPLTQNYQTEQKDLSSKMPDICLHLYSTAQIASLQLSQVTLQPEFNLNNVTYIHISICSIMLYYSGGDLRYE